MRGLAIIALCGCGFEVHGTKAPDDGAVDMSIDIPDDLPAPNRIDQGLVGRWRFNEGSGLVIRDTVSEVDPSFSKPPMDLQISSATNVQWMSGTLHVVGRAGIASMVTPQAHVNRDVLQTGEVTLEVWVQPDAAQGSPYSVVFSLAPNPNYLNASIIQRGDRFVGRLLTSSTSANGLTPEIESPPQALTAPIHLVLVASDTERVFYVNGTAISSAPAAVGSLSMWRDYYRIALADDLVQDRQWLGRFYFAAAYDRALSESEVRQNFMAGHDCSGC